MVLAVNVHPQEDGDVVPFITGMKYGFIPLRVPEEGWAEKVYRIRGTPQNFLIGPDGLVYGKPMIDGGDSGRTLGLMIEGLLEQAKTVMQSSKSF